MRVGFWGVRGSYPCWGPDKVSIGGHTSCVSLDIAPTIPLLIFDLGSGLIELGEQLMQAPARELICIVSHFHFDHIMGLPFFKPLYDPSFHITFYAAESANHASLEHVLRDQLFAQPLFPVPLSSARANLHFNVFHPDTPIQLVRGVTLSGCALNHPGHSTGYRIDDTESGKSFCYISDHEHGTSYTDIYTPQKLLEFVHGTDLMVFDTMYLPEDMSAHQGWGHSSWHEAVTVAREAEVKKLALFHVNPEYSDQQLRAMEAEARFKFSSTFLAREGQIIDV